MNSLRQNILQALTAFVNSRPGLDFGNYGDVGAFRSEMRSITKDRAQALELLSAVSWRESITAETLIDAAKHSFSGRLSIGLNDGVSTPTTLIAVSGAMTTVFANVRRGEATSCRSDQRWPVAARVPAGRRPNIAA